MAKRGSLDGDLATIDLSSASDSVTLRLVTDIFGPSKLGRWLLATRSTHTLISDDVVRIAKFAPMGSACCFPVQCLIFAGVILATHRRATRSSADLADFRVFGDDIICPSSISYDVMENLVDLGFSVNTEKTYVTGDYRESCGMDAWCGHDVTPLKIKSFGFNLEARCPLSYESQSRMTAYVNGLYVRGYQKVRSFLLERLLTMSISLGKEVVCASHAFVFGSGSHSTVLSTHSTNFHLSVCPLKGYQRDGFKCVRWVPKKDDTSDASANDAALYAEWLRKNSGFTNESQTYDLAWFQRRNSKSVVVIPRGVQMVPTFRVYDLWFEPVYHTHQLVWDDKQSPALFEEVGEP
jgi:hypothetical protein